MRLLESNLYKVYILKILTHKSRYKKHKKELLEAIKEQEEKKQHCDKLRDEKRTLIANVRISLRQIHLLCSGVKTPEERQRKKQDVVISSDEAPLPPPEEEIDGKSQFFLLETKLLFQGLK